MASLNSIFETGIIPVNAFKVKMNPQASGKKKVSVASIELDGRELYPTDRFWSSMQMRFRFRKTIFKYFTPDEVFDRITQKDNGMIRYCIENTGSKPKLLAMTNPAKPVVNPEGLEELLAHEESRTVKSTYANGVIQSCHNTATPWNMEIAGESFGTQFYVDTPIDGFGKPQVFVSLLRQVCANGLVGYAPAFRTELNIGKKDEGVMFTLERAMQSYSNDELFTALVDRMQSATKSYASVFEAMKLHKLLIKIYNEGGTNLKKLVLSKEMGTSENDIPMMANFFKAVGDLNSMYGLTNMDSVSSKKQKLMPTKATMYDLINFATETSTHICKPAGSRKLNGYVGDLLATEYDLEGTADGMNDWQDLFLNNPEVNSSLVASHSILGEDD